MPFTVGHLNVRSVVGKLAALKDIISKKKYDFFGITETWLDAHFDCTYLSIPGYTFHHLARPTRGGGVGFYVRDCYRFSVVLESVVPSVEQLWVRITVNELVFVFGVVYRPNVDFANFIDVFENSLTIVHPLSECLVCVCDFNINALGFQDHFYTRFSDILETFGLSQIINEPTRVALHSSTLIDYIIVCDDVSIADSGVLAVQNIADHSLVYCTIDVASAPSDPVVHVYRNFRQFNLQEFLTDLYSIPFFTIFDMQDIDDKLVFLVQNINFLFDLHAPLRTTTFKGKNKPWVTDNLKQISKLKKAARRRYSRTQYPPHLEYYKQLRNFSNYANYFEKRNYLTQAFRDDTPKNAWNKLRALNIASSNRNPPIPHHLCNVNEINNYFSSVQNDSPPDNELLDHYYGNTGDGVTDLFEFVDVTEEEVERTLRSITSSAVGSDGVSVRMLKYCSPFILTYIRHIFNHCLQSHTFPDSWKVSLIKPLSKTRNPSSLCDLRPISILPVLSKMFERLVAQQLRDHLTRSNILPIMQSGFRAGYGCPAALLNITDDVLRAMDAGQATILVALDYSKAFDTINHSLLLSILKFIGLGDGALALFRSYLLGRKQVVKYGSSTSDEIAIISGVPQGSILGPMLYIVYTSSLYECLQHCRYHAYADDTQIYSSANLGNIHQVIRNINSDLERLVKLSSKHNLTINPLKSQVVLFGSARLRESMIGDVRIQVNDVLVPPENCIKNLGLLCDSELRFRNHVRKLLQKSYSTLKVLYSNRYILNQNLRIILCDSLILSNFNYCDVVYHSCIDAHDKKRIQTVQNSCLRFIYGLRRRERISHMTEEAGWLCMADRRSLHAACAYHTIIRNETPPYLYNKIKFRTDVHNINVRRKDLLDIPKHNLETFKRSFTYCAPNVYNKIPAIIKNKSVPAFRTALKRLLCSRMIVL